MKTTLKRCLRAAWGDICVQTAKLTLDEKWTPRMRSMTTAIVVIGAVGAATVDAHACTVTGGPSLSFGTASNLATAPQTQGNISTSSLLFGCQIVLSYGQGAGAGISARRYLRGPGGVQIEYNLYRDSARTRIWGDSRGVNTLSASFSLFGNIPFTPG